MGLGDLAAGMGKLGGKSMNFFGGVTGKAAEVSDKTGGFFGGLIGSGKNIFGK